VSSVAAVTASTTPMVKARRLLGAHARDSANKRIGKFLALGK